MIPKLISCGVEASRFEIEYKKKRKEKVET